jgi:hypothetical protein
MLILLTIWRWGRWILLALLAGAYAYFGYFGPAVPPQDHAALRRAHALTVAGATDADDAWTTWCTMWDHVHAAHESLFTTVPELEPGVWDFMAGEKVARTFEGTDAERKAAERERLIELGNAMEKAGAFKTLDTLAHLKVVVYPTGRLANELELRPDSRYVRHLAHVLAMRIEVAGERGDERSLVESVHRELVLAQAWGGSGGVIDTLVEYAVRASCYRAVQRAIVAKRPSEAACRELLGLVRDFRGASAADGLQGERLMCHQIISHTLKDIRILPFSRSANIREIDRCFDEATLWLQSPVWEAASSRHADAIQSMADNRLMPTIGILMPAFGRFINSSHAIALDREAAIAFLAVEAFIAKTGHPPQTLDELVPEFLDQVPVDSYTPGAHFIYRTTTAASYTLYTMGADGKDNAARAASPRIEALHPNHDGYDYVFHPLPSD